MGENWRKEQKYAQLDSWQRASAVEWKILEPDARHTWLTEGQQDDFQSLIPLGLKESKGDEEAEAIFRSYSLGGVTARDAYVFNSSRSCLETTMRPCNMAYQETLASYEGRRPKPPVETFIDVEDERIKWSSSRRNTLNR